MFLHFQGEKPEIRRKLSWNIGEAKNKDSNPKHFTAAERIKHG
jgi:hypothetical protein